MCIFNDPPAVGKLHGLCPDPQIKIILLIKLIDHRVDDTGYPDFQHFAMDNKPALRMLVAEPYTVCRHRQSLLVTAENRIHQAFIMTRCDRPNRVDNADIKHTNKEGDSRHRAKHGPDRFSKTTTDHELIRAVPGFKTDH